MKTKHITRHPQDPTLVETRTSMTKVYSHAVWARVVSSDRMSKVDALRWGAQPEPGPWFVIGWASRRDLAEKVLRKETSHGFYEGVIALVEVVR